MSYELKLAVSGALILVCGPLEMVARMMIIKFARRCGLRMNRIKNIGNFLRLVMISIICVVLMILWGLELKNLAIYLSGLCGMVAIGFIATWSALSNITAGLILFFMSPFKEGDRIYIAADNLSGTVEEIGLMFTILKEQGDDSNYIVLLPNNTIFQKTVRKIEEIK